MKRGFILKARKSKFFKVTSAIAFFALFSDLIFGFKAAYALTSGPVQQDFAGFEPASSSEMVDLYSGDFVYNIPLLNVPGPNGGYPINMAYHSGVGMDQEASWIGLGWSLNVGAINRQLRGIPDDFNGDEITQKFNLKKDFTVGLDIPKKIGQELFGFPGPASDDNFPMNWQVYYNSYKGVGYRISYYPKWLSKDFGGLSVGVGLTFDSQSGIGVEPKLGLKAAGDKITVGYSVSASINSRDGYQGVTHSTSIGVSGGVAKWSSGVYYNPNFELPSVSIPTTSTRFDFDFKLPIAYPNSVIFLGTFNFNFPTAWSGFYEQTKLKNGGNVSTPAYGYANSEFASGSSIKDFIKQNNAYSKNMPNILPSTLTYDFYSISGQGIGGTFRAYRSDVSTISDANQFNSSKGHRLNLEFGIQPNTPPDIHVGIGYTNRSGGNYSGEWKSGNQLEELNYENSSSTYLESSYLKMQGEQTAVPLSQHPIYGTNTWAGEEAVRVGLELGDQGWLKKEWQTEEQGGNDYYVSLNNSASSVVNSSAADYNHIDTRIPRSSNIQELSQNQAAQYGFSKNLDYYTLAGGGSYNTVFKFPSNLSDLEHPDHTSEYIITQPSGMRYIYGLPTYNKSQTEAVFSVSGTATNRQDGLVDVPNGGFSTHSNHYQSIKEIPSYASTWLLTGVVSADYIDRTDDGITEDDYGYWVKFKYVQTSNDFKWRVPYSKANYIEGNYSDDGDDLGSYTYGEKEIYHIESIETKTHIAKFIVSQREDGIEAKNKNQGGKPTGVYNKSYKLDRIELYTKAGYSAGKPAIKNVHFNYSYDLCPNVPNNSEAVVNSQWEDGSYRDLNAKKGKLTLEKIHFTYNNSIKGELTPYRFDYGNVNSIVSNPSYDFRNYDRWGNYSNNMNGNTYNYSNSYPFKEYPYTYQNNDYNNDGVVNNQDDIDRTDHASAWHLKKVLLPTGSELNIDYEQDDYAYVEDNSAMQMFDIIGLDSYVANSSRNSSGHSANTSYTTDSDKDYRVHFDLLSPIDNTSLPSGFTSAENYFKSTYLKDMEYIYFKTKIDLLNNSALQERDFVSGYAKIDKSKVGLIDTDGNANTYEVAYITLDKVPLKTENSIIASTIHPFRKAAFNHLKLERMELMYEVVESNNALTQIMNVFASLSDFFTDLGTLFTGFEVYCDLSGYANTVYLDGNSVIRLYNPDGFKHGGGTRVKSLTINDTWKNSSAVSDDDEMVFGQTYDYTKIEEGKLISSGVAYEPNIGGDENALREPIIYEKSFALKTNLNLFVEKPIMEAYYPGARVGYGKVTVKSVTQSPEHIKTSTNPTASPLTSSSAPLSIYEFYTGRDFPVLFDQTDLNADPAILRMLPIPGISSTFKKKLARSQGYSLVLNDMPGKMKSIEERTVPSISNPQGTLISKQEYIFSTKGDYDPSGGNELENKVQIFTNQGTYEPGIMGTSHDIFVEMHEDSYHTKTRGLDLNIEGVIPFIPFVVPVPIPNFSSHESSLKTVVTNKLIYKTGILQKVIATEGTSKVTTENLAYDPKTGHAILTKMNNEFDEEVFSYMYPAHWNYSGMDAAYKNTDFSIEQPILNGWVTTTPSEFDKFHEGDEIWVSKGFRAFVTDMDDATNRIYCVDNQGAEISYTGNAILTIIRSGHRNQLNESTGSVLAQNLQFDKNATSSTNIDSDNDGIIEANDKIVSASTTTYHNGYGRYCCDINLNFGCDVEYVCDFDVFVNVVNWSALGLTNGLTSTPDLQAYMSGIFGFPVTNQIGGSYCELSSGCGPIISAQTSFTNTTSRVTYQDACGGSAYVEFMVPQSFWNDVAKTGGVKLPNSSNNSFSFSFEKKNGEIDIVNCSVSSSLISSIDCASPTNLSSNSLTPSCDVTINSPFKDDLKNLLNNLIINNHFSSTNLGLSSYSSLFTNDIINASSPSLKLDIHNIQNSLPGSSVMLDVDKNTWTWKTRIQDGAFIASISDGTSEADFIKFPNFINANDIQLIIDFVPSAENTYEGSNWSFPDNHFDMIVLMNNGSIKTISSFHFNSYGKISVNCSSSGIDFNNNSVINPSNDGGSFEFVYTTDDLTPRLDYIYRPYRNYSYRTERDYSSTSVSEKGFYTTFKEYDHLLSNNNNWIKSAEVTKYSPFGFEVESKNALEIYSAALYDRNNAVVEGVANNTRLQEIAFEGFEFPMILGCGNDHWYFKNGEVSQDESHTGKKSIKVDANKMGSFINGVTKINQVDCSIQDCGGCNPGFSPISGKKYLISAWTKEEDPSYLSYSESNYNDNNYVKVRFLDEDLTEISSVDAYAEGPVIEGWQRVYYEFSIPSNADNIQVLLLSLNNAAYFDDIRIQPSDALMNCYVYDPYQLRVVAELDQENYATIKNYDDEGHLLKVKRETYKGIKTIKEGWRHTKKSN